jgi:GDP-mannose 6-dehydrogenase
LKISIFGLGYVGTVSLACLARKGHSLIGVDVDPVKLELIAAGKSPVIEEGLSEAVDRMVAEGRIAVTKDARTAVLETGISMICVATPSAPNGSQDQKAIVSLTRDLAAALAGKSDYHLFVYRSTVIPGTVEETLVPILEAGSGKNNGVDFDVCFQPEFTREGNSIRDFEKPPFTIVGTGSPRAAEILREIFGDLPADFLVTSVRTAELVKYCCNDFHALKITFANEIGRLCEALGCDPVEVMSLVCRDTQLNISPAYLKPGFAFGGSCLPKDLRATLHLAKLHDAELPLLASLLPSNRIHVQHAIDKVLAGDHQNVGMVGLSFKAGTDDLRESPLVLLAEQLIGKGVHLKIYDPEVRLASLIGANLNYIRQAIPHIGALLTDACEDAVQSAGLVVLGICDEKILQCVQSSMGPDQHLLDLVRIPESVRAGLRCQYQGLCW